MSAGKPGREVEIKLRMHDAAAGVRLLTEAGFRVRHRRLFERNVLYDTGDGSLRRAGRLLRVRQVGEETLLTYKGPGEPGKHKVREEIELELSSAEPFDAILNRLGFAPSFRYEKFRTEFDPPAAGGIAMLDETPIGTFLELEGDPDWIDRTAATLGFSESAYITASYAQLHLDRLSERGEPFTHMLFERPAESSGTHLSFEA